MNRLQEQSERGDRGNMTVYRCEDSLESIFTAIYLAYEERRDHMDTCINLTDEPVLFAEDVYVTPDQEKINKVMRSLYRIFGEKDYMSLCMALASREEGKAQAVYRTVVDGLSSKRRAGHLFDNLANDDVYRAFALARVVGREVGHLREFLRFQEMENGVLCAKITPENNVAAFLMPHFSDRLPQENFMIYDATHRTAVVHSAGKDYMIVDASSLNMDLTKEFSPDESHFRSLWCAFFETIAVEARENAKLQIQNIPKRFWADTIELCSKL